ncbi:hypothetical protein QQF64_015758 [Cirrhinus molitorella]|uniref:Uncharacterized protein n=1 Tax=Cirrhinus molitorella TaxID=172907 RepID=A0ABR3NVW6_9TELE
MCDLSRVIIDKLTLTDAAVNMIRIEPLYYKRTVRLQALLFLSLGLTRLLSSSLTLRCPSALLILGSRAPSQSRLECPAVSRSQWEEMKHDTREPVKAPAHPLPENTSARPPGNLQLALTHARHGSGRAGETLPQEPETDREPS